MKFQILPPSNAEELPCLPEPEGTVLKNHLKQVRLVCHPPKCMLLVRLCCCLVGYNVMLVHLVMVSRQHIPPSPFSKLIPCIISHPSSITLLKKYVGERSVEGPYHLHHMHALMWHCILSSVLILGSSWLCFVFFFHLRYWVLSRYNHHQPLTLHWECAVHFSNEWPLNALLGSLVAS